MLNWTNISLWLPLPISLNGVGNSFRIRSFLLVLVPLIGGGGSVGSIFQNGTTDHPGSAHLLMLEDGFDDKTPVDSSCAFVPTQICVEYLSTCRLTYKDQQENTTVALQWSAASHGIYFFIAKKDQMLKPTLRYHY